ncbi:MAG: UDP-N-acetylmuramate dehydrogenase [Bdellovibrionales bacterium]
MIKILENEKLAPYTSWLIGGVADYFCLPKSVEELKEAWTWAESQNLPVTWFGGGTNLLVSDLGVRGLTICLRQFSEIKTSVENNNLKIKCLSGTAKSELLKVFLKQQLAPALFLAGLPGDVGGGIVMNAGVAESFKPREFGELVESFKVLRRESGKFNESTYYHHDVKWSYRHCHGWGPGIITEVVLNWPLEKQEGILHSVKEANKSRLVKQPLDWPSCGSVFINPPQHKAAQLIEACGLKGFQIGDAQVSKKHSNFIINLGKATAADTWAVIQHVKKTVLSMQGVDLNTEVVRIGDWSGTG